MAVAVDPLLTAVGVMVVAAFLGAQAFRRWRMPDVLLLILLGVLLGPWLGFVDVEVFRQISPLVGTVAIIVILFDGGREIRFQDLRSGVAAGGGLAILVFSATALLCAGVGMLVADLDPRLALLLGMAFGGAGAVVVIPLIQHLHVRPITVTVVAIEAAVSDVLVILGVVGLSTAIDLESTSAGHFARELFVTFALGISMGVGAGFAWSRMLSHPIVAGYGYVLTLAMLFLLYVASEVAAGHGAGALAVLAFGLIVGNARHTAEVAEFRTSGSREASRVHAHERAVFGEGLVGFHHEAMFFIRAFFFMSLGVTLDLSVFREPTFLLVGFLLAAGVAVGRAWGVYLLFSRRSVPVWDRTAMALMFPLGLAAAALSQVPAGMGIEGTERFASYAAVAIVLTNLATGVLVWSLSRPAVRARMERPAPPPLPKVRKARPVAMPSLPRKPPGAP